jgi:hypothetical protein
MSFCQLKYDTCAYKQYLAESIGTLAYVLDDSRYNHRNPSRIEHGIVGGNDVSIIKGNLVDLESDLKGQTRLASKCPSLYYQNPCPNGTMNTCQPRHVVIRGNPGNMGRVVDTTPLHLRGAQMFRYTPIPLPPAIQPSNC